MRGDVVPDGDGLRHARRSSRSATRRRRRASSSVPYRELAAPPPLPQTAAAGRGRRAGRAAPSARRPGADATRRSPGGADHRLAGGALAVDRRGRDRRHGDSIVVAPPSEEELPQFGEYVYVEELPEAITKVAPEYPDLARAGERGRHRDGPGAGRQGRPGQGHAGREVESRARPAAEKAVKQWVFKPALSNNKPVAVWVAVPIRFVLN